MVRYTRKHIAHRTMTIGFIFLMGLFFFSNITLCAEHNYSQPLVTVLTIDGAIGPAVQEYVEQGIQESEKLQAQAIVLTIDTPGGLDTSMRGIIKSILHSTVPVMSYVAPSYVGFILIVLGIIFMVAEAFLPSFGALGFGGIVSFVMGSFLLFKTDAPGFTLPWQLITGITITTSLFLIGLVQLLLRSRYRPVVSGTETLIEKSGVIEKDGDRVWVTVSGERWKVKSNDLLHD